MDSPAPFGLILTYADHLGNRFQELCHKPCATRAELDRLWSAIPEDPRAPDPTSADFNLLADRWEGDSCVDNIFVSQAWVEAVTRSTLPELIAAADTRDLLDKIQGR